MPIEANYNQYTEDNEEHGWLRPSYTGAMVSSTLKHNFAEMIFAPFVLENESKVDALFIETLSSYNRYLVAGLYSADKYGMPSFAFGKSALWETNAGSLDTWSTTQLVNFPTIGAPPAVLKPGIWWVGILNDTGDGSTGQPYTIKARECIPSKLGVEFVGSKGLNITYKLNTKEKEDRTENDVFTRLPGKLRADGIVIEYDSGGSIHTITPAIHIHLSKKKAGD